MAPIVELLLVQMCGQRKNQTQSLLEPDSVDMTGGPEQAILNNALFLSLLTCGCAVMVKEEDLVLFSTKSCFHPIQLRAVHIDSDCSVCTSVL